jgi:acid phosphatase
MMLPYLNNLVQLLAQGPGITGTYPNGSTYTLPDLIMAFANDGQLTEFSAAVGVFDTQTPLSGTVIPSNWYYIASHFVSMRGTVALERLNCNVTGNTSSSTTSTRTSMTASTTASPTSSAETANCNRDNCLRQFLKSPAVTPFCATYTAATNTVTMNLPSYVSQRSGLPSRISSACSCIVTSSSTSASIPAASPTSAAGNQTYIRIRLNDAVYPVTACRDGPGRSCSLSTYVDLIAQKYNATGNWHDNCNVTNQGSPEIVKGASFFTDLSLSWLNFVTP